MLTVGKHPSWQQGTYSIYVHVPFCRRKCPYCHFYVLPFRERDLLLLGQALQHEWAMKRPATQGLRLASLYFGGGTPALVPPALLGTWIDELVGNQSVVNDLEITLEANPEDLSKDLVMDFQRAGVNRLSLGVQSFIDEELRQLGRGHSAMHAEAMVQAAASAGITNLSIDLMFETPGQTEGSWLQSLQKATQLPITHLSLYNLTIEPHTAFDRRRKQLEPMLPSEDQCNAMLTTAIEHMNTSGFDRYELSAFCKNDLWSRHNTGYWLGRPFFGLGPSAWSFWQGRRFRNLPRLHRYAAQVRDGEEAIDEQEQLSANVLCREMLAVQLRLTDGIEIKEFEKQWGSFDDALWKDIRRLIELGLVNQTDCRLVLSARGQNLHDSVAAELVAT